MKRIFLTLSLIGLILPALPRTASADIGLDFFYNNLSGGSWIEVSDYGYCWQPDVAVNDSTWRPYADGYWAYTDVGWTWVSYEDFGWATYHYGRWARLADYGWVWVPGADLEWGPAWVSWRTGGDYIGWAPLPPRGPGIVYESQPIGGAVDVEFDIGPEYYNFCDVRYIGEPVLRQRIVDVRQNATYVNQTVNVTNITVNNNTVYNYGPDINAVNQRSSRPIQRLRLERQQNVDVATAARSGAITKVQGNSLVVAAPMKLTKPAQPVAPPTVKARVTQAKIERGWAGINPNEQAKLKQKIKTEDRTKVPPPTSAGAAAAGQAAATAPPAGETSPATASPAIGAKGKSRLAEQTRPSGSPAATKPPTTTSQGERELPKRGKQLGTPPPVAPGAAPAGEGAATSTAGHGRGKGKPGEQAGPPPPVTSPASEGEHRHQERSKAWPTPAGAASPKETFNQAPSRHGHAGPGGTGNIAGQGAQSKPPPPPAENRRAAPRPEGANAAAAGAPAGAATRGPGGQGKQEGKNKPEKGSPSPHPQ
jgi:hypothetical protein